MKNVIITGASKGIGAETARVFAENGYNVIVNYYKSEKEAFLLKKEISEKFPNIIVDTFKCDIKNIIECQKMVDYTLSSFGKIDCLIANAGIAQIKLLIDTTDSDFDNIINTNLKGVYNIIKTVTPNMISNKKGKIVTVSSILGLVGDACESLYCASKFGIIGLTKSLAKELGKCGININSVAPGYIETDMNSKITKEEKENIIEATPLGRVGSPRDVAEAIYFLSSDKSDFITGSVLSVDGSIIL